MSSIVAKIYNLEIKNLAGLNLSLLASGVEPYLSGVHPRWENISGKPDLAYLSGDQTISGIKEFVSAPTLSGEPFITGFNSGDYVLKNETGVFALNSDLNQSGSFLFNSLTGFSGAFETRLVESGYVYQLGLDGLSGSLGDLSGALNSSGETLFNRDDLISGALNISGGQLAGLINDLSGSAILIYGDQSINGLKRFNDQVYIQDLYVTGTQTIVNTTNTNVGSNYVLLNATGGAVDAGVFIVTGLDLTGVNDTGAIIGYDIPANNWVFGLGKRGGDLSGLNKISSTADLLNYSGFVTGNYLRNNSSNIVYNTGNQMISGVKTFTGILSGNSGSFNDIRANNLIYTGTAIGQQVIYGGVVVDGLLTSQSQFMCNGAIIMANSLHGPDKGSIQLTSGGYLSAPNWKINSVDGTKLRIENDFGIIYGIDFFSGSFYTGDARDIGLSWRYKVLSGDWATNTTPTQSGHIINKGYLDRNPSGFVPSGLLGSSAYVNIGTGEGTVASGNDPRFSDSRAPLFIEYTFSSNASITAAVGRNIYYNINNYQNTLTVTLPRRTLAGVGEGSLAGDIIYFNITTSGITAGTVIIREENSNGSSWIGTYKTLTTLSAANGYGVRSIGFVCLSGGAGWQEISTVSHKSSHSLTGIDVLLPSDIGAAELSQTVQITGNQDVSGIKSFFSRPTVNGTGILLSGEAITGVDLSSYATTGNLSLTGVNIQQQINDAKILSIAYAIAL